MIAGLDTQDDFENFTNVLGYDIDVKPKIGFIFNYLQPNIGTPLEDFDITRLNIIDIPKIKLRWKLHNSRILIYHDKMIFPHHAIMMTAMERSDFETIHRVLEINKMRKGNTMKINELFDLFDKAGLLSLLNGQFSMPGKIIFPYHRKTPPRKP